MKFPTETHAIGQLYSNKLIRRNALEMLDAVDGVDSSPTGIPGWHSLTWKSSKPLIPETEPDREAFLYPFLYRESRTRFLLLSIHHILIDKLVGLSNLKFLISQPVVHVSALVQQLSDFPGDYCLSTAFARVVGYGRSLRTVALYGDDIVEAELFAHLLPRLEPYRVTLRDVRSRTDVLTVGSRGDIQFYYRGFSSLNDADTCLRYLSRHNHLDWDLEHAEKGTV